MAPMSRRRALLSACAIALAMGVLPPAARGGPESIRVDDLRSWLSYIASDELAGRATYSAGLDLAAEFIEKHLRQWRLQPAGDAQSYSQTVRVQRVRATSRSTVSVQVGAVTRTYADGEGITLPRNQGGERTLTLDRVEFVGYGLDVPAANHVDYRGKDVRGAAVVWLGTSGPKSLDQSLYRRLFAGRNRHATVQLQAAASIGPAFDEAVVQSPSDRADEQAATPGGRGAGSAATFTTAQRLNSPVPPIVSASDEFYAFLFSKAPTPYDELRRRAAAREPLPTFRLEDVTVTFHIDVDYQVERTDLTRNVVAVLEGSDPGSRGTYVAFGAHYDHVGLAPPASDDRRGSTPGRITPGAESDRIWNGADDNGSGTVALMALARAFAEGPRPRRSLLFVWHAGEETGLLGSRYFADHPTVPIDAIVAQLNIDMIGRNRNDDPAEANTVYLVGSDRISSELHEINRAANRSLPKPLTLDYELNDPADLEQFYFRSDHYSYASKGIPVIFFTTGLHRDYHANTDDVSKIEFDKLTRIAGLVYETGARVANLDQAPARDFQGPRAGKGTP
jgi:hypothetical protein